MTKIKRALLFLIIQIGLILLCFTVFLPSAIETPDFSLLDETVEYSPEGYMPKIHCEDEDVLKNISYFAIDKETTSPVNLPIKTIGTYQIFAKFSGSDKYSEAEATCTVTITPVTIKILTPYKTAAYSKMENPILYTLEPEWVKDYVTITIDYYPIETLDSFPSEKISAPINLGLYYTVFNVESEDSGIICENKYMIYEIAAYRGKKLSAEEQAQVVPKDFSCTFQNVSTVYEKGTSVTPGYALFPKAIEGEIQYRQIFANGSLSEFTTTPPTEPGEYQCVYFLGGINIGEGNVFIDKKEADISIDSFKAEYSEKGITPSGNCEDEDVKIAFTAFVIDENGNVTTEEAPIPLKKCGRYSIIAYPEDNTHYKRTYAYGTIEITLATPEIKITSTEFVYDGTPKNVGFEVYPSHLSYEVLYYEWEDREENISIGASPSRAGKYMAVINVFDEENNYNPISKTVVMYIDEVEEVARFSKKQVLFINIICVLVIGAIGTGAFFAIKATKRKKSETK